MNLAALAARKAGIVDGGSEDERRKIESYPSRNQGREIQDQPIDNQTSLGYNRRYA